MPARVPVVVIGGGPAGLLLARLLQLAGVDSVILERQTRGHVMARVRAGVLEWGTVETLRAAGVGERMDREGTVHDGVGLSFSGRHVRVDFKGLTGRGVMVYGQTEVTKDLYAALDDARVAGGRQAPRTCSPTTSTGTPPTSPSAKDGASHRIDCDYVAGCDGSHGVSRTVVPAGDVLRTYERIYPFGWLGILSETPPVDQRADLRPPRAGASPCARCVTPR